MNFLPAGAEGYRSDDSDEFQFSEDHEDIENLTSSDFGAGSRYSGRRFGEEFSRRGQQLAGPKTPNGNGHQRKRNGGLRRDQRGSPLISEDLKMAASKGNLEEVQNLLNRGLRVDTILSGGWTALMYSLHNGHVNVVNYLLEKEADVDFCSSDGLFGPLLSCCSSKVKEDKQLECLQLLLQHSVNLDIHEGSHITPLMFAAQRGHVKVASKLILAKSDVNKQDNRGWTALCYAAMKGETRLVKLLLDNGADPTKACSEGMATDIAYGQGFTEISDILDQVGSPDRVTMIKPQNAETELKTSPTSAGGSTSRYHVYNDLDLFLCGLDLSELIQVFNYHKVDFADLLRLTEEDLEKMGVDKLGPRRKIMRSVHEIHKLRWERGSISNPSTNVLSQNESRAILDNISQHLSYINSCLDYMHLNWSTHKTLADNQQDGTTLCHLSELINKLLLKTPKLQNSLQNLNKDVRTASETKRSVAADLIVNPDSGSGLIPSPGFFMFLISGAAIATAAFYFWYPVESSHLPPR